MAVFPLFSDQPWQSHRQSALGVQTVPPCGTRSMPLHHLDPRFLMMRSAKKKADLDMMMKGDETTARGKTTTGGGGQNHLVTAMTAADEIAADHATDHIETETEIATGTETGIETDIEGKIDRSTEEGETETEAEAESNIPEVCFLHQAHMFSAYDLQISHRRATTDHAIDHDLGRLFAMAMQPQPEGGPLLHPHDLTTTDHLPRIEIERKSSRSLLMRSPRSSPTWTLRRKRSQR